MSDEMISLNVGGRSMVTTRSTLTKVRGSLLERMFDPSSPLAPARSLNGAFFIDEDPEVFRAILSWLRHGTLETKNVTSEHVLAAANYFGLACLKEELTHRMSEEEKKEGEESRKTESRWHEFLENQFADFKWIFHGIAARVKDLPNFVVPELLEFQIAMALSALDGGTLTQICRHICLKQLSEESHTSPADICSSVMFTLKKMQQKVGPLQVREDEIGIWHFVSQFKH